MARSNYVRPTDEGFAAQMQTFKSAIGAYAATLRVSPASVTTQAADADYFSYVLASQNHAERRPPMDGVEGPASPWR